MARVRTLFLWRTAASRTGRSERTAKAVDASAVLAGSRAQLSERRCVGSATNTTHSAARRVSVQSARNTASATGNDTPKLSTVASACRAASTRRSVAPSGCCLLQGPSFELEEGQGLDQAEHRISTGRTGRLQSDASNGFNWPRRRVSISRGRTLQSDGSRGCNQPVLAPVFQSSSGH